MNKEDMLGKLPRESGVAEGSRRNVRRQSVAIFNAFEDMTNEHGGLLDEEELAVGDEDIVIPVGGRVTKLRGSESSAWEAKVEPHCLDELLDLPNPDLQDERICLRDRIPSMEDSLLLPSILSSNDDDWLLPVPKVPEEKSSQQENEKRERRSREVYLRKPSRLQPPSTGSLESKQTGFAAAATSMQHEQAEKDSPFTKHLKFLEEHPEKAFSASQSIPEDHSIQGIRRKTSLERHLELWGISRLPSLNEK